MIKNPETSGGCLTPESLFEEYGRRIKSGPTDVCPVDMTASLIGLCQTQSCGKCAPCRVGLQNLSQLICSVLDGTAGNNTLRLIQSTARVISDTADCAIGQSCADVVLNSLDEFEEDYNSHLTSNKCTTVRSVLSAPCSSACPAGVDVPGYLTLVGERRYDDAIKLIRRDNPFAATCGYVCERPCEARCRRGILDEPINIRGIKRFAADNAGVVPVMNAGSATGKKVAVVGGGPAGLSCAYFLRLMGHSVTVFEKNRELGGLLRYRIPSFRLPAEKLKSDLDAILATGVKVQTSTDIGGAEGLNKLRGDFDAIYIAVGTHYEKKLQMDGGDCDGVYSAVELLRTVGDGDAPDFTGKSVVVIGGGNVAVDAARTAVRLGANHASIVYRRRIKDMPAHPDGIAAAISDGITLIELLSPSGISSENGKVSALRVKPQIIGAYDRDGKPTVRDSKRPEAAIPCDVVVTAIGQDDERLKTGDHDGYSYWGNMRVDMAGAVTSMPGVFAGGDFTSGSAGVVRAVAEGKMAAYNIDKYLGFDHKIKVDISFSFAPIRKKPLIARVETRTIGSRVCVLGDECDGLTREEVSQEAMRCLRCDRFGFGAFGEDTSK